MTLEQLRIFLEVAQRQHVTEAARMLNLTQSAVSAALAALESRHGVALFDRIGRGIWLNEAGRSFLPYARDVLQAADLATRALDELRGGHGGQLRVSASQTVAGYYLASHLMTFRTRWPDVELSLQHGNTASVIEGLRQGAADLGVVEGQVSGDDLELTPLAEDELVILVGSRHPWAGGQPLTPADLASADWVLREPGSGTRATFDQLAQRWIAPAQRPRIVLQLPSNEACIAALRSGTAVGFLSALAAAPHLAGGEIRRAAYPAVRRQFTLVRHKPRQMSRAARNFAALLEATGPDGPPPHTDH